MDVIIWGTGTIATKLSTAKQDEYKIIAYGDNDKKKWNLKFQGRSTLSFAECVNMSIENNLSIIIAIEDYFAQSDVANQLIKHGVYKIGLFIKYSSFVTTDNIWKNIILVDEGTKAVMPYLETNITDCCNLHCQSCTHFANLFQNDDEAESIADLEKDLQQLTKNVHICKFRLLGGEPLLVRNLKAYMEVARKYLPHTDIRIASNGIMINKLDRNVLSTMSQLSIGLDITPYPPVNSLKNDIISIIKKENIRCYWMPFDGNFLRILREEKNKDPKSAYNSCLPSKCRFLRKGKIYTCPIEGLVYKYVKYFEEESIKLDYNMLGTDINDTTLDWPNSKFIAGTPCHLCSYCEANGGITHEWQQTLKPEKSDWLAV